MTTDVIKIIFGGGAFMFPPFTEDDYAKATLDLLKRHDVDVIDTAQVYGDSEAVLGKVHAAQSFTVDTKALCGLKPGTATRDGIVSGVETSLERLGTKQVDIFYLHAPDATVPIEETLAGIDDAHKKGSFKRFGLSNYSAEDVRKVYDLAKSKGWVLPTAYQGNYSPVARKQEKVLFPTLRELGMAFYAYSPLAGGFLTKSKQDITDGKGRFDPSNPFGKMYTGLYARPTLLDALATWDDISRKSGIKKAELAYRWVAFNSDLKKAHGDGIIVGARSTEQLEETLAGLARGPLPADVVKQIDQFWDLVKDEAPLDNVNG